MKMGIWTYYYRNNEFSFEEKVQKYLDAGIKYGELSDEDGFDLLDRGDAGKVGREIKRYNDECGFYMPQGHLWLRANITADDYKNTIDVLKNWLDLFLELDIKAAVLHAGNSEKAGMSYEVGNERRITVLKALCDYLKGTDLSICMENLIAQYRDSTSLFELIDAVGSDNIGICLDTGHLNISARKNQYEFNIPETKESHYEFITRANNKLRAVHIADNDSTCDHHMMPYGRGTVDWNGVLDGFKDIDYKGFCSFEIPGEANVPLGLKQKKLEYVKCIMDYMTSR